MVKLADGRVSAADIDHVQAVVGRRALALRSLARVLAVASTDEGRRPVAFPSCTAGGCGVTGSTGYIPTG